MRAMLLTCGVLLFAAGESRAEEGFSLSNVNLRSGPGTEYNVVGTIPQYADVDVSQCSGGWCRVTWNGKKGYASEELVVTWDEYCDWAWDDEDCDW